MIDIHSHILNEIDDGSKSLDMSINMLKKSEEVGVQAIVATPHFMRGRFEVSYDEVIKAVEEMRNTAKDNGIEIEIYAGQEVYYSRNMLEYYNDKLIGTINNSRYMLIELPMLEFNLDEVINTIYELQIRGIVPIIAHPERYKPFIKKPSLINALIKEGMLFQMNAASIVGDFGKDVKKTSKIFLENNIYSFMGSDAHRDRGRDTDISEALKILEESQKQAFISNATSIIKNEEVNFRGNTVKEKKFFGLW